MKSVIEFPMDRIAARPSGLPPLQAEVIIFPGVRIERRDVNGADRLASYRRSPEAQAAAEPT